MKGLLCIGAACIALAGAGAQAADMPLKAPIVKAPPVVYGWTGFYVGANGGYGWQGRDRVVSYSPNDPVAAFAFGGAPLGIGTALPNASFKSSGGFGGFQLGYNRQFDPHWIAGFEADLDASGIKGSGTSSNLISPILAPSFSATATASEKLEWFGTARARLGYLVGNELLLYGTGGLAYGRVAQDANIVTAPGFASSNAGVSFLCSAAPCFAGSSAHVRAGWSAGAGAEWAFGSHVSFKLEYLYVNLGTPSSFPMTATATLAGSPVPSSLTVHSSDADFHMVRVGLNYRFGDTGVFAKY